MQRPAHVPDGACRRRAARTAPSRPRHRDVAVGDKAADLVAHQRGRVVLRVVDVDVLVGGEVGVEGDPQQPAASPAESSFTVANGVGSIAPSFTTRTVPFWSVTNSRPSGAAIAAGLLNPLATCDWANPAGTAISRRGSNSSEPKGRCGHCTAAVAYGLRCQSLNENADGSVISIQFRCKNR